MEIIGWLGSLLLAFCGLPQALHCIRNGHARGLDAGFIGAWLGGEIFTVAYVIPKLDWPLIFNYSANIFFILIMVYYRVFPRK